MAAVSVGLCAKAADPIDASTFTENGTSFDGDGEFDNGQLVVPGQFGYWEKDVAASGDDLYTVTNLPENTSYPSRPAMWAGTSNVKALSIDTANPILRNVNPVSNGNPPLDVSTTPVFFDSVVQFTATDVAPSLEGNTTDKLMVWLYSSADDVSADAPGSFGEESPITTLVVTAGKYANELNGNPGEFSTFNYPVQIDGDVELKPDTWHRLTIKAIADVNPDEAFYNPVFEIWVDGKPVSYGEDKKTQFPSLKRGVVQETLQGVAFDGKGAVDDIVFTTTAPEFATNSDGSKVFNVAITAPNGVEIDSVMDANGDSIEVSEGKCVVGVGTETIIVLVKCAGTVTNAGAEEQESGTWAVTVDVSSAKEGDSILVEITVDAGGSAKPTIGGISYETEAALKAVVKSGTEITVPSNWTVDGKVLKDDKGATFATFEYYNLALANGIVTATLDQKAAAPFAEANDLTEGQEVLEVGEDASGNPELTVRIKPYVGLYYGAMTGTSLDNLTLTYDYREATTADVIGFTAKGKAGDTAGFIKVVVTDIAPEATEK